MRKNRRFTFALLPVMLLLGLSAVLAFGGVTDAAASPLEDYRQQQKELQEQMDSIQSDIKEQNALIGNYQDEIASLDAQLVLVQQEINALRNSIAETNAQIDVANQQIADAEARLAERQATLESRLVDIYMYGDISIVDVVFEAATFNDFVVLYDMVERLMAQDEQILEDIRQQKEIIEENRQLLVERKADLNQLMREEQTQAASLQSLQDQKYAAMDEANMTVEQLKAAYDEADAASEQVAAEIRKLLAASPSTVSFGGAFIWPLPSAYGPSHVTSEYGTRLHPILQVYKTHAGIDIGAPNGTQIYAAADGKVLYVGWISGYGQTVMIDHGNSVTTLYGHMSAYGGFSAGQTVSAGDVIGYVGSTGQSTGNHLHFEVRVNGNHTNPWNYLN
ncbi:MAG: peptidoglycan DD-metalloendopeptidase family protein [Firmicutes bacterium]|nr:peptidoglycan DD-metalloendopeptidase family protein [Bacillota bacterium]